MHKKRLSMFGTFFFKVMFPAIWIGGFGHGTLLGWQSDAEEKYVFLVAWIIGSTIILLATASLKCVKIEDADLVISNYIKTIRVPLSQIHSVSENYFVSPKLVWITFKAPTVFGDKIKFSPVISLRDWFCAFHSHSIVKELRELSEIDKSHSDS